MFNNFSGDYSKYMKKSDDFPIQTRNFLIAITLSLTAQLHAKCFLSNFLKNQGIYPTVMETWHPRSLYTNMSGKQQVSIECSKAKEKGSTLQ